MHLIGIKPSLQILLLTLFALCVGLHRRAQKLEPQIVVKNRHNKIIGNINYSRENEISIKKNRKFGDYSVVSPSPISIYNIETYYLEIFNKGGHLTPPDFLVQKKWMK